MTHFMTLHNEPFDKIYNGLKTIELRLNDEKRKQIKVNDILIFQHINDNKKSITAKVKDMLEYYSTEQQTKYGVLGVEFEIIDKICN